MCLSIVFDLKIPTYMGFLAYLLHIPAAQFWGHAMTYRTSTRFQVRYQRYRFFLFPGISLGVTHSSVFYF